MVSRTLYRSLPLYSQWFDEQTGSVLAHLCNSIQPELDTVEQILTEYEYFLNLDSPLNDEYLDFLQQFVGAAPIEGRYLGIGLDPGWSVVQKKRVIARLFQYWQSKGTESAMRLAIAMWLQWPEAEAPESLDIRRPFGSQISSEPDNWWHWGTPYDAGCYQSYKDTQIFYGGDIPGFNYQPPGLRLIEFVDRWQWSVEVWSPRLLDPLSFPVVKNSRNYLGSNHIWLHFKPGLDEFPTWNQIFNDYSVLSPEIVPSQTSDLVFQWVEQSIDIPVIGLDPSENLVKRTNYELEGYNWGGLDLWPFPGLSKRTIKKIEIQDHEYFFQGWQWGEDLFPGDIVRLERTHHYTEVEIIVEGTWGTRYGDLSALEPFHHWDIVEYEIITSDNYSKSLLFWTTTWNSDMEWFYPAKNQTITSRISSEIQPTELAGGTLYFYLKTTTNTIETWKDIPTGLSSEIQLWGGSISRHLMLPDPGYIRVPVIQAEYGLNFLANESPLTAFYFAGNVTKLEEITVLRTYNFLGHTEFRSSLEPIYNQGYIPSELWGTQFAELIPISSQDLEHQTQTIINQESNSSVVISWGDLGTELRPSSQPWVWIFDYSVDANPPITINTPGLKVDSAADYLSWDQIWYFPSQTTVIFPPENQGDNIVGDYPFIFNQGYQWPSFLSRQKVKDSILSTPLFNSVTYPSIQWFYPPVDRIVSHEWVEILNPSNRLEEQPVIAVSSVVAGTWDSGIPWIYQNPSGRVLDEVSTISETSFIDAQPWAYSYRKWIELVLIEDGDDLIYNFTPGAFWYVNLQWQELIEVIVSEINTEQCFLGKIYNLKTSEIINILDDPDSFINVILRSTQFVEPEVIIRPAFGGIFPGSQWLNLWLQLTNSSVALFEIEETLTTESFGEIDLGDWHQDTLFIDLGTDFQNLVYNAEGLNRQEKIDQSKDTWYTAGKDGITKPGRLITRIGFEQSDCSRYYDNWLSTCFWAKLHKDTPGSIELQPIYSPIPLCNIPSFFSDRSISSLEEELIVVDPDLTLFEEFPDFIDWFKAENWSLLVEVQGEVFRKSPVKVVWDKENLKSIEYSPGSLLSLEFVFAIKENADQIDSARVRSVALLFQDMCIHFQTCELHGKLNTRSDYLLGVRYLIVPKFESKNYITINAEILI